ncbi:MAG TPA: glycosyltransferase family 2 protein, partial [Parafilimonas sp.]|nr:glycosyltransferase family 2 protein [Parafilimonas sp.]
MQISVVIPTCNRKKRLLFLLGCLNKSEFLFHEVIVVDSGDDRLSAAEVTTFNKLLIKYISSERSVCIQRNIGIRTAESSWIFLCDDDVEVPVDYIEKLAGHINAHAETGAVSGLFLQKQGDEWTAKYPVASFAALCWKYIFKLSMWGEITCRDNLFITRLKRYYVRKGNHISKAGWPVITDFSGDYFKTPLYSLGASLIRRDWLLRSPFDEVLDRHGIGEHYGVITGFPSKTVDVLNTACVYHHEEQSNRIKKSLQYYRRVLTLDYFRRTSAQREVKKFWLLWSLLGNLLMFIGKGNWLMIKATSKVMFAIGSDRNPYCLG